MTTSIKSVAVDYTDIANRVQAITGRSVFPSTVEAILKVAGSTAASTQGIEDAIEEKARELFEAQADALASPWDMQWDRTKQYWRKVARESLLTSPTTGADGVNDGR